MKFFFTKIFGTRNDRYIKSLRPVVQKINALEPQMQELADTELAPTLASYKERVMNGESLNKILPEVFALVRETSLRILGMRHYDVQLMGGITLHQGKIAEMKTGEGKTLMATLPVVLNTLTGKGVHVVTVNDYLAKRDSEWMGKLYQALGLTCGVIVHGLSDEERQEAYNCDITYGTNNEFGFDYLRDNMKFYAKDMVQRGHNFAIVDEVDSILIDEARTPLIISGAAQESTNLYLQMNELTKYLKRDEHFTVDEKTRSALLTEDGVNKIEEILRIDNLFDPSSISLQHHVLQALRANHCYQRDVDYMVTADKKVVIIDEFTGRPMEGRRFGDGLHQALEAKEKVKIESENQTLASITYQNYFRMYEKLAGMTGTAQTEAVEFMEIYGLETITVPTNKPMIRKDYPDIIYRTQKEKFAAITNSIKELHQKGQPVLVGTISIETSEYLSGILKKMGIPHNVLNAKYLAEEAQIVAEAGQKGRVTIATNMAGRGTDIKLGEGVEDLGGLHILGTERHESRRIDNQLRGRSGRQGDSGSSRFYLSLEDNLMRIFGSERISTLMQKLGMSEGEAIENKFVSKAIENAQKKVEAHNFEIRKTLLDYDNVMNQQRTVIYDLRKDIILEEDIQPVVEEFADEVFAEIFYSEHDKKNQTEEHRAEIGAKLLDVCNIGRMIPEFLTAQSTPITQEECKNVLQSILTELQLEAGPIYQDILRYFVLEELDRAWKDHLKSMDYLREGIGLRGYGQRDPKLEYKREGFELFQNMLYQIKEGALRALTRVRIQKQEEQSLEQAENTDGGQEQNQEKEPEQRTELRHREVKTQENSGQNTTLEAKNNPVHAQDKIGRNDPCPCGSGKKYKKCHGAHLEH
ncbi:preprotein translocase subunit SecA [Taurinivorans muris]|uniref:Protein translocase subunit SecA n=1 Tax=Taurinivorans muris TaxID=2787751 RepID=A0ABY5Y0N5_9BACT|nr:preprotein translocase subunit SecA [Desulfovibrionaceae bacterium LT0009]